MQITLIYITSILVFLLTIYSIYNEYSKSRKKKQNVEEQKDIKYGLGVFMESDLKVYSKMIRLSTMRTIYKWLYSKSDTPLMNTSIKIDNYNSFYELFFVRLDEKRAHIQDSIITGFFIDVQFDIGPEFLKIGQKLFNDNHEDWLLRKVYETFYELEYIAAMQVIGSDTTKASLEKKFDLFVKNHILQNIIMESINIVANEEEENANVNNTQ